MRCQCLDSQFKANLVVALAGCAVADGNCALFFGDLNQTLCDNRPCVRGSQKVLALINGAGLYGRDNVILNVFITQIFDIKL